jgi:hypothetical protein
MDIKKIFIDTIVKEGYFTNKEILNEYKVYYCINDFKYNKDFEVNANSNVLFIKYFSNETEYCAIYKIENGKVFGYNMLIDGIDLNEYFILLRKKRIEKIKLLWESGAR